jgi:hypothetical protein
MFRTKFVEEIKTYFVFSNFFSFKNCAVNEIMWKNIVERGWPQMTIWRMRIACWKTKATNTHSQYVTLIAFPLQQWLHERASMLRYIVHCLSRYSETRLGYFIHESLFLYTTYIGVV